jgi:transitional endoplasmic reticulum ATPase
VFIGQRLDFVYLNQSISFVVEDPQLDQSELVDALHSLTLDHRSTRFYRISPADTSITVQFDASKETSIAHRPSTSLMDIGGLKKEKANLADLLFTSSSTDSIPVRGILLYGPKGCGKTMLINAIAEQLGATIVRINPSDIYSRHYGESETKLKRLFAEATVKRNSNDKRKSKSLIIVENIESLCPNQERTTQQLERRLTTTFIELLDRHLDGIHVLLIATTNHLDSVDVNLRRPGRIDEEIEIGIPNQQDRLEVRVSTHPGTNCIVRRF